MSASIFIDTNILIYALGKTGDKKTKAIELLEEDVYISTQVLSECANVCLKKLHLSVAIINNFFSYLKQKMSIVSIDLPIITQSLSIHKRYGYNYYDAMIISAALASKCDVLISEDLQHQQRIEALLIVNPFL